MMMFCNMNAIDYLSHELIAQSKQLKENLTIFATKYEPTAQTPKWPKSPSKFLEELKSENKRSWDFSTTLK